MSVRESCPQMVRYCSPRMTLPFLVFTFSTTPTVFGAAASTSAASSASRGTFRPAATTQQRLSPFRLVRT